MSRVIPSFSGLEAFEATARLGSVTRAAAELNLTQSAVSRHIAVLEQRLGVTLFLRQAKRLALSEAGAAYLPEVRQSLQTLQTATTSLIASRGRSGSLSIATLPTFGVHWLVPRLHRFRAQYPRISIHLVERPEPFDFAFDRVDCAIHFGQAHWPGAKTHFLFNEALVAVASPAISARLAAVGVSGAALVDGDTGADADAGMGELAAGLQQESLVHVRARPFAWRDLAHASGLRDLALHPQVTVDSFAMALAAARSELGVAVLPSFLVTADLEQGRLCSILPPAISSDASYYFVEPDGRGTPYAVQMFADWLYAEAGAGQAKHIPA